MSITIIKKERSRAYPVMPLAEALSRIGSINDNLGINGHYNRETIATGMGYNGLNGASARAVAALTHYGFLDREKDQYSLSALAKKYLMPLEDDDRTNAIHAAALSPQLFIEIYRAFKGQVIPKQFVNRLIQEFGIQQKAAPDVERIFRETMVTAGILKSNNVLRAEAGASEVLPKSQEDSSIGDDPEDASTSPKKQPPLPDDYLTVTLPSGLLVGYKQSLASAFAFGIFGEKLKELDNAVTAYKQSQTAFEGDTKDETSE
jgi:hypothetical protein